MVLRWWRTSKWKWGGAPSCWKMKLSISSCNWGNSHSCNVSHVGEFVSELQTSEIPEGIMKHTVVWCKILVCSCYMQLVTEGWSVCRTTVEQLQNEINALDTRIKKVRKQIDLPSTEKEIKMQMGEFLQVGCSQQLLRFYLPNEFKDRW
jgi:hypothetical protein